MTSLELLGQSETQKALLATLATEVALVEEELERRIGSRVQLVTDVSKLTLRAGGKRLRPAFVTLAAEATGLQFDAARTRCIGACMEMIHMATLIHDDVIDNSEVRRGQPTAAKAYGATGAILSGDVLLARAMAVLAEDGDLDIIRCVAESVVEMAEGEAREVETRSDFDLSEAAHMEILRMKTAAFIASCCRVGAQIASAPRKTESALFEYGIHVGLAFQIADDLLDYRGDAALTGKAKLTDFQEGCATLPLIFARESASREDQEWLRERFGKPASIDDAKKLQGILADCGAFALAENKARQELETAITSLQDLPENSGVDLLESVANYVVCREL